MRRRMCVAKIKDFCKGTAPLIRLRFFLAEIYCTIKPMICCYARVFTDGQSEARKYAILAAGAERCSAKWRAEPRPAGHSFTDFSSTRRRRQLVDGAKLNQALVRNVRTCRSDAKGDVQAAPPLGWVCADPTENLLFVSKAILVTPAECTNRRADSKPQLGAWAGNVLWSDPDLARDRRFADSPLEGTGFELPVRGRGQSGCRPFCAAECSGRVGAPSQFSDSTTPCIKAEWTRPPRPQSVPATHSAEFCLVREENGTALPGDRARRSRPGARQPLGRSEGAAAGPPSSPSGNPIWSVAISTHSMA
jgi:hypothetical protein